MTRALRIATVVILAAAIGRCGSSDHHATTGACGNGVVEANEACDLGANNVAEPNDCPAGTQCCTAWCTSIVGEPPTPAEPGRCGNGMIEPRTSTCDPDEEGCLEQCDDGSRNCPPDTWLEDDDGRPVPGGRCPEADPNPCCQGGFNAGGECVPMHFHEDVQQWHCLGVV